ncbi:MAG: ABC transporter substrate-binding protein [Candidatus Gracilibacteria bacterium]|nr:ABC transporter substrate-binding protein [Candidatus Gracilibacteria bacterium]MDD5179228.1 ABC transporter substrate-binding protein [Candidatus Gracilibacteria bacterium]
MFKLLTSCTLTEKILVGILTLIILISSLQIGQAFYYSASQPVPGHGGTYVEGVVGDFSFINPLLAQTDLDRDLTSLVFAGLTKFDPVSNNIVDDLATHTLSPNQRVYTFTLRDNLYWHDGVEVTADDVIFTFKDMIQNESFPNPSIAADFANVEITKVDEKTVKMTLAKQYAFFIYNTTVGLLPKHILENVAPADLLTSDFNLKPIGCGPFKIDTVTSNAVQLTAFDKYHSGEPYLNSIIFRIFQSKEQLLQNLDGITGTKDLSEESIASFKNDARLTLHDFTLPQYVALFFNTQSPILSDKKLRLGLQLATNKQAIADKLAKRVQIIDTPLLEIATSNWKYDFDAGRADGALFDAGWKYRSNTPAVTTPAATETTPAAKTSFIKNLIPEAQAETPASAKYITDPSSGDFYATGEASFYLLGNAPAKSTKIVVNGYQLNKFTPSKGTWSYKAALNLNTLKEGENVYKVANQNGEFDSITIFYSADETKRKEWLAGKEATPATPAKTTTPVAETPAKETTPAATAATPTTDKTAIQEVLNNPTYRYNGDAMLSLKLLISDNRPDFKIVAEEIAKQWKERGVKLTIESLAEADFLKRMNKRDYDMVLFGENLGYNLDTYSFWHSSEARENGNNLSNLKSSSVNAYLEQVRASFDSSERRKRLATLREALSEEVPGVMLYTPTYSYAVDSKIKNFNLGRIALKRDRLAGANQWYLREAREATSNLGVWNFFKWFFTTAL